MLNDQPEDEAQPSQKLVLPDPVKPDTPSDSHELATTTFPTEANRSIGGYGYRAAAPTRPSPSSTDPVYRFLYISIALVIVACIVIIMLVGPTLMSILAQTSSSSTINGLSGSKGNSNPHSTAPSSGGGHNSTPTSQPSINATPTAVPTLAATATPTGIVTSTALTVQITSVPQFIGNNTNVMVNVLTNQPNSTVQLFVIYNASPIFYKSQPQETDGSGLAAIPWHVHVVSRGNIVTAHLYVTARDPSGQQATSTQVIVQISGHVGG